MKEGFTYTWASLNFFKEMYAENFDGGGKTE